MSEVDHALRERLLRRGLKFAGLLILVYYLLPKKIFGVPVYWSIPLGAAVVLVVEVARLSGLLPIPALRDYERGRPAGYVYWGASLAILVAFFPESFAVAALVASSVADVLAGELRRTGKLDPVRARILGAYWPFALVALPLLAALSPEGALFSALLALAGAVPAALIEGRIMGALDDDLLMPLLAALVWVGLVSVLPGAVPLGFHLPWLSRG
ncbi:MAG: hypothetical protein KGJ23_14030 [Euryarchaeota archaeon]|nr:hypothetical protein [Euryarchaeota archaeon]MDE1837717.1 hypothetical protein [Euryarchaeota archaeon]MDE1881960.1 hypothetical protein [Euryarchaeota archaeon]MDE2046120.1 hypothetical protein [Thermoplasmata archaeon]